MDRTSEEVTEGALRVATGLPDDRRGVLQPGDGLYGSAEQILRRQNAYATPELHAEVWSVLLPLWPLETPSKVDGHSIAAAVLSRDGLTLDQIHDALGHGTTDVVRRREGRSKRERPNLERGERLLERGERESVGTRLRRIGTLWDPELALPRVYRDGEEEPDGFWNPLLDLAELGLDEARGDGYVRRAEGVLFGRWLDRAESVD